MRFDPKIMEIGKTYTSEKYPWSISGNWWDLNNMNAYTNGDPPMIVSVSGSMDVIYPTVTKIEAEYSRVAFDVLGIPYPGN